MPEIKRYTDHTGKLRDRRMPTYQEYVDYAKASGFQPLSNVAFDSLVCAGFNPVSKQWIN